VAAEVFERLAAMGIRADQRKIHAAYQSTPVITDDQLAAMKRLLTLFAALLVDQVRPGRAASGCGEPLCVAHAKRFVQAHLDERLTLKQIAAEVNLSPFHFSRIFRRTTNQTLWQYMAQLRVERAKASLADPFLRVSEIAYAAGFGSIAQFNAVFRRQIGMSPQQLVV
jgi:AraC-like DNA-binding protein